VATKKQLAIVQTLRRSSNQGIKVMRHALRGFLTAHKAEIMRLALAGQWDDIDKIFSDLPVKVKPALATVYGESANIIARSLGIVKKADEDWADLFGPDVSFDIWNPRVVAFLESHGMELSKTVSEGLRHACIESLAEGYKLGESIPHLMERLEKTLTDFSQARLEMIARSETLMASQKGAIESYIQSGVIHEVKWLATEDERACDECSLLDGMTFNVSEVPGLPHPDCRCTVVPII